MNWEHLKTFVWLRWRLVANRNKRSGSFSVLISRFLMALMGFGALAAFLIGFLMGFLALGRVTPLVIMLFWDGAVIGFLFFWMTGFMAELQRSELLSLDRFLHLPVSPSGAFLINYLGSSVSISLLLFLPGMTGLSIGLVLSHGAGMLALFPLVAAFFLMITALTYQFRGWLASMMTNPRRRRTVISVLSIGFMAVFMLPQITGMIRGRAERETRADTRTVRAVLDRQLAEGEITREEYDARAPAGPQRGTSADNERTARVVNMVAPPGWLPYGAAAATEGRPWPVLAGTLGMALIGTVSLKRSYRTTIRMYTGEFVASGPSSAAAAAVPTAPTLPSPAESGSGRYAAAFVEKRLPWISEHASAVATACFRGMLRAQESKMLLLSPLIMVIVFSGMFGWRSADAPELLRPLSATGLVAFIMVFGMVGFVGNQFGFDRHGFRAYVLSPASRRDILLGKNLALFPFALGLAMVVVGMAQWMNPMRLDHLAGVLIQSVTLIMMLSLAGNVLSILSPIVLKPGSGMPAGHQGIKVLYQIGFMLLLPIPLGLTLVPLGIEFLLRFLEWQAWFPAFLVFSTVQMAIVAWLYSVALGWQGELLYRREREILEVVTTRVE